LAEKVQTFFCLAFTKSKAAFHEALQNHSFPVRFWDFQDKKGLRTRILGLKDETELTALIFGLSALALTGFLYNIKTFQSLNIATICVNSQHGKNFN
jgi:hypothetical protein